jgi:hypothetical protein
MKNIIQKAKNITIIGIVFIILMFVIDLIAYQITHDEPIIKITTYIESGIIIFITTIIWVMVLYEKHQRNI